MSASPHDEFTLSSLEQWRKAAAKSAPGGDLDALSWHTPEGIAVKPLYTAADTAGLPHADTLPGFEPFVRGPQADRFAPGTWKRFTGGAFTVSSESNRVGVRLRGPVLRAMEGADIVSEGIVTGAIQVTGEGQPIVMLPGHATIGGYTKIATVIDADLDRLGQLRPGDTIRFREVSLDEERSAPDWSLPDLVRLARVATDRRVGAFAFTDRASGASLRLGRGNG